MYLLGFILHFVISSRIASKLNLERRVWIAVSICYVAGMVPGAKFLYHWHHFGFDPMVVFSARDYLQGGFWGGMLVYFGLAIPIAMLLTRKKRAALDLIALTVPIPWTLGKVGCLLNGCCNGGPCSLPWAITFPEGSRSTYVGIPVHPSQIYEILAMIALLMLFRALNNESWRGALLFWFVGLYGIGRAVTDVFRGDIDRYIYIGPVTLTQLLCLVAAAVSFVVLIFMTRMSMKAGNVP
jgi:phosphatidylglycerol:prolipoprotein diacylglycerol transferase